MGLNYNKFTIIIFILLMLSGFMLATTTTGVITFPSGGETVGHNFTADFNLSDTEDANYSQKTVLITIAINDINVLTDLNLSVPLADGRCSATDGADGLDTNVGSVNCQLNVSTTVSGINEGSATMRVSTSASDSATDINTSLGFTILKSYRIQDDSDVNKYSQTDIQDLSESGIGEGTREVVVWIAFIVLVFVAIFVMRKAVALKKA